METQHPSLDAPYGTPVPAASEADRQLAMALERELVAHRRFAVGALLTGTTLLRMAAAGATVAVGFDLVDLFGGRPGGVALGVVGASQAIPEMAFAPLLARLADRLGRRSFLVGGPLIGAMGALLLSTANSPATIVVSRMVEGVGAACFVPTALGTIAAATTRRPDARADASGAFEGANLLGYAGGFIVGPFAYHAVQHGAFLILAALYVSAAAICGRLVPHVPPLPVSPLRVVLRAALGPGPIRTFLPAWVATFALLGAYAAHLPALLRRTAISGQTLVHHFDERLVSPILVSWIVLLLIGIALWTPGIARRGAAATMSLAAPGALAFAATLLVLNHVPLRWAPVLLPFLGLSIVWLAGFGPAAVTYLAECSETFAADRAALMAFYTVALAGGGAIGSILGGIAVRLGYADGLVVFGGLLSLFALLSLRPVRRYERALVRAVGAAAPAPQRP